MFGWKDESSVGQEVCNEGSKKYSDVGCILKMKLIIALDDDCLFLEV